MAINYDTALSKIKKWNNIPLKKNVLLIDGTNTFVRAMSKQNVINETGIHIGGLVGFLMSIGYAIKHLKPLSEIIVIFDGHNSVKTRLDISEDYKANRRNKKDTKQRYPMFDSLHEEQNAVKFQMNRIFDYFEFLPMKYFVADYVEADDVIGYIATNYNNLFDIGTINKIYIMSTDKDFYQGITENVNIYSPTKKIIIDNDTFTEMFNIIPENYTIMKSVMGDNGDNVIGIKGIKEKTFLKMFPFVKNATEIFDVESFYERILVEDYKENCGNKYTPSMISKLDEIIYKRDLIELNWKLVDLRNNSINNIDSNRALLIKNMISKRTPMLNKYKMLSMLMEDGGISYIKNPIKWCEDVFLF